MVALILPRGLWPSPRTIPVRISGVQHLRWLDLLPTSSSKRCLYSAISWWSVCVWTHMLVWPVEFSPAPPLCSLCLVLLFLVVDNHVERLWGVICHGRQQLCTSERKCSCSHIQKITTLPKALLFILCLCQFCHHIKWLFQTWSVSACCLFTQIYMFSF